MLNLCTNDMNINIRVLDLLQNYKPFLYGCKNHVLGCLITKIDSEGRKKVTENTKNKLQRGKLGAHSLLFWNKSWEKLLQIWKKPNKSNIFLFILISSKYSSILWGTLQMACDNYGMVGPFPLRMKCEK